MQRSTPGARSRSQASAAPQAFAELEYALLSMIELSQGLTVTVDLYRAVDTLLLSLMGQLGTSRALLWLTVDDPADPLVLVRNYGVLPRHAEDLSDRCAAKMLATIRSGTTPVFAGDVERVLDASGVTLIRQAGIVLLAPIWASGTTLGMVAVGPRLEGTAYGVADVHRLEASLGIAGIALQNGAIHSRLIESSRQLRQANEELRELDRMKSEFLQNVNHELRTPLAVIVPTLECALNTELDNADLRQFLESSLDEARKMVLLVENLLTLSDLARKTLAMRVVERDLVTALTSYHNERLPGVNAGLRDLSLSIPAGPLPALFDEVRLRQILDALVDNAVKFTPPGSQIALRIDSFTERRTHWARIRVEDNGPGIPEDRLRELFDAFRQLDGSTTRSVGGMGIGLALARELADRMGGRLLASSQPGRGSTFALLLPTESPGANEQTV